MKVALIVILYITVAYSCAITYWVKARYIGKTHLTTSITGDGKIIPRRFVPILRQNGATQTKIL